MTKIFIDAGHGGSDSGAVGNGLKEKDLNLTLALKTRSYLNQYEGANVKLSRETDQTLSLKQRTDAANEWGADLLLSIHINAAGSNAATGFETFVYPNVNSKTIAFQNTLHDKIINVIDLKDRGKKQENFHMLRESNMAACLTENGFINNPADAKKMNQESWLDKVAKAHAEGIVSFLGLKRKASEDPQPEDSKKLYRVQIGAFSNKENAEAAAKRAEDAGFNAYIYED